MIKGILAVLVLLLIGAFPGIVVADSASDYEIAEGHFYTQGNGLALPNNQKGFSLTNEDNALIYAEFRRLGGVSILGYPISQRFQWEDRVSQVTQRALLQWHEAEDRVVLFEIFEYLSKQGWDDWLRTHKSVPARLAPPKDAADGDAYVKARLALLDQDPGIKAYYLAEPDSPSLYGLPASNAEDFGPFVAMRFQRAVLQRWKVDTASGRAGDVTAANAGEIVKELNIFPASAMAPEDAPSPEPRRRMPSSRGGMGGVSRGLATWYGAEFQGSPMRNGQPYDMYDADIAASNSHAMGTRLRVTSLATGVSIVVKVSDTGAFRHPIVVDLSWAAFRRLANPDHGVIEVAVELLRDG